jgi:hypothetical protein
MERNAKEGAQVIDHYEIRVLGPVDEASLRALQDLEVDVVSDGEFTVASGPLDQPALHGLLERLRARRLELEDIRRVRPLPPGSA